MRAFEIFAKEKMKEIISEVERAVPDVEFIQVTYLKTNKFYSISVEHSAEKGNGETVSTETKFRGFLESEENKSE